MKTLIIETPTFILGFVSDLLSQFSYVWVMSRALFVSLFKMKYEKERDWDWDWGETEKQLIFNFFFLPRGTSLPVPILTSASSGK